MEVRENVPISSLTTMRLGGNARYVVTVTKREDIPEAYRFAEQKGLPVWILGAGANTIGRDGGFAGVIIKHCVKGIKIRKETDSLIEIKAQGGEIWDDLVEFVCQRGFSGIEAMSMIPGTVGAAPVQNIGAYGQDLAQVVQEVEAYDTKTKDFVVLQKSEMKMGYRHTRFNFGPDAGRFFIVSVVLQLHKNQLEPPFYNSLQRYIDEHQEQDFSPMNIRRMVCEIRGNKLPDPEQTASAGSFFKNVYLTPEKAEQAAARGIPMWRNLDGSGKINSGWLIEQCGLKGKLLHGMRVSDQAALVLINESAKNYQDLAAARAEIIDAVRGKFNIVIEQEPVEIPSFQEPEEALLARVKSKEAR